MSATPLAALDARLASLRGLIVAFSGGVDSAVLLHAAVRVLGADRVLAATARSPSLPARELDDACALARSIGVEHRVLETRELDRAGYRANATDRCYHCKSELFDVVERELGAETRASGWSIAIGAIVDDASDHRPGARAARERGVLAPLADAGFDKRAVRDYARAHGLVVADKPASACLASRVAYGIPVEATVLSRIERGEALLHAHGFGQVRLRHHGALARIEVEAHDLARIFELRDELQRELRALGWNWITVDLAGYRSGSMNEVSSP